MSLLSNNAWFLSHAQEEVGSLVAFSTGWFQFTIFCSHLIKIMEISALLNQTIRTKLLLLLLLFTVHQTGANNKSSILGKSRNLDDDDTSWINSNFPIAAANSHSIANFSEQCLQDTMTQLAALRDRLPWAVESKKYSFFTNNIKMKIDKLLFVISVRIVGVVNRQNYRNWKRQRVSRHGNVWWMYCRC